MKAWAKISLVVMLLLLASAGVFAEKGEGLIIPLYTGSEIRSDDLFGFEEFPFVLDESTVLVEEGYLRRVFCLAPENRSPLEIVKNYEKGIQDENGTILFSSRKPQEIEIEGRSFKDIFWEVRNDPGFSTQVYSQHAFPGNITEYLVAKLNVYEKDIYIILAAGRGDWAASQDDHTFYELAFLEVEAMEMEMVTAANIATDLKTQGRIAIYELFFDTGKGEIKPESAPALQVIADYLKTNKEQKVLIVGHTDSTGDFDLNLELSKRRADAVVSILISDYGVNAKQMRSFGAGSTAPISSNTTEEGRAKNRRVEMVEQ